MWLWLHAHVGHLAVCNTLASMELAALNARGELRGFTLDKFRNDTNEPPRARKRLGRMRLRPQAVRAAQPAHPSM